jgi:hypothetical protein
MHYDEKDDIEKEQYGPDIEVEDDRSEENYDANTITIAITATEPTTTMEDTNIIEASQLNNIIITKKRESNGSINKKRLFCYILKNILKSKLPLERERGCLYFILQNSNMFDDRDWVRF